MPGRDPSEMTLQEGRVYDRHGAKLLPQHGRPLPVGSFLKHGDWFGVTLPLEEVAAIETRVVALLEAERAPS